MKKKSLSILLFFMLSAAGLRGQTTALSIALYPDTLLCNGLSNGEISFIVSGGSPPYFYEWEMVNNNFVFAQGNIETEGQNQLIGGNLNAGGYVIQVTDMDGLNLIDTTFILTPYPIFIADLIINEPSCPNSCDADATLIIEGGTGEILTTWSDIDDVTASRTQLCKGLYSYFLVDENGCTQKGLLNIDAPSPLSVVPTLETPSCIGFSDGRISLEIDGGTIPYSFYWEDGSSENSLDELTQGIYNSTIEDANGCSIDTSWLLLEGLEIIPNVQLNYGCGDGRILAAAYPVNGQSPYEINWSTGWSGDILYDLSAGDFSLTLTDANGCMAVSPFTVDFVAPLTLSAQVFHLSCPDGENGGIDITLTGGLPPFIFSWSNGDETEDLESVSAGVYTLNVLSDACALSQSFAIVEPPPIEVDFLIEEESNGLLSSTAFVSGGTLPYTLQWSNGDSGSRAGNLESNQAYGLTVTDQYGCTASFEFEALLTQSEELFDKSAILLYPNPVTDWLYISVKDKLPAAAFIQIFDAKGAKILQQNWGISQTTTLDLHNLRAGIYTLCLLYEERSEYFRIIKK